MQSNIFPLDVLHFFQQFQFHPAAGNYFIKYQQLIDFDDITYALTDFFLFYLFGQLSVK